MPGMDFRVQVRIKLEGDGIVALLKSNEVESDLKRRGDAIANRAGPEDFECRSWVGFDRAHATVAPSTLKGYFAERDDKALTKALDAARH
jgi:hypothetical protein